MKLSTLSKLIPQNLKNNAFYERLSKRYIRYREEKVSQLYSDYETILNELHDTEKGNTCIIMGTGPSLSKIDKSILKKYPVIGVNNSYKAYIPKYHVISDIHVLKRYNCELQGIVDSTLIFLCSVAGLEYLNGGYKFCSVPIKTSSYMTTYMSLNLIDGIQVADNVIVNALQVAYHLGFENVYLIGCDFDYGGDKEHFDGSKVSSQTHTYKTGDWSKIFHQLEVCKDAYELTGRNIYNATVGGKLEVFQRRSII